jgi:hypothetical protein
LLLVETKSRLDPKDVTPVVYQLRQLSNADTRANILILAPFLGQRAREKLSELGANYADATGNLRMSLETPTVFIESTGLEKDPWPDQRPLRTLRGRAAGRAARALTDFEPPYGIRELAGASDTSASSLSRVADLLEKEAIITQEGPRGRLINVDWQALLRRWSRDYSLMNSNRISPYLEPRGLKQLTSKLVAASFKYAVTGSLANAHFAPVAEPRLAVVYVPDFDLAAVQLDMRPAETGGNVVLAEPFDPVVFERTFVRDGTTFVAPSQIVVDLLTSPGRGPNEAEALMAWMAENEDKWRTRISTS